MIDLGIATSVAKKHNYSWQKTINLANSLNLNSIQFYIPDNGDIPCLGDLSNFKNIYLHLPNSFYQNYNYYLNTIIEFKNETSSNKLILHQNEEILNSDFLNFLINNNAKGFTIGIENEGKSDLYSYLDLIKFLKTNNIDIFAVLDVHRFYNNYYEKYSGELITEMILQLITLCLKLEIKIVLHLIDSSSFNSDRRLWTPIFEGKLPYKQFFGYIFKKQINIESIILEYESEEHLLPSFDNIKNEFNFDEF